MPYCIFCGKDLREFDKGEVFISTSHFDNEHSEIMEKNNITSLNILLHYLNEIRGTDEFQTDN